jgi:hypothetical protein
MKNLNTAGKTLFLVAVLCFVSACNGDHGREDAFGGTKKEHGHSH